jgi:hypothetical protein
MTYENYIKGKLVDVIVTEAYHHGGSDAMLAVAQVLANRVAAGWNGGDWLRVIDSAPFYRGTVWEPEAAKPVPNVRDGGFRELLRRVDDVYHGTADDSAVNNEQGQKALYYAELHNLNRVWFKENILNDLEAHPRIAVVGQMTFFA